MDAQVVANIVLLLAVGASVQALTPKIFVLLRPLGLPLDAVAEAVKIGLAAPVTPTIGTYGPSVLVTIKAEPTFRATYILQAARRIAQARRAGESWTAIRQAERRLFVLHRTAQNRRLDAAKSIDVAGKRFGPVLGWYAVRDNRTTPECRAAHGHNFHINERPLIGYPGTVHPLCRCKAGAPFANATILPSRKIA